MSEAVRLRNPLRDQAVASALLGAPRQRGVRRDSSADILLHVEHGSKARRPSSTLISLRNSGTQEQDNNNQYSPTVTRFTSKIVGLHAENGLCRDWLHVFREHYLTGRFFTKQFPPFPLFLLSLAEKKHERC